MMNNTRAVISQQRLLLRLISSTLIGSYWFILVTNRPIHHLKIKPRHVATYLSCVDLQHLTFYNIKTIETEDGRRRSSWSSHKKYRRVSYNTNRETSKP